MGSTFGSLATMMTSLRVQSMAQQIIANNIANATTKGYSRQIPVLAALAPLNLPSLNSVFAPGQIGTGVRLVSIERVRDEFLDLMIRGESARLGEHEALQQTLNAMAILFPELNATPGQGLITAVQTFFDDWSGLAAGTVSRAELLSDAQNMATLFHEADATLREMDTHVDAQVRETMTKINGLLVQIADANRGIVMAEAAGGSANALMDSRDQALTDLSKLMKVDTVKLADGSVLVMTGNAKALVRGSKAGALTPLADAHEPAFAGVGLREAGMSAVVDVSDEIGGGAIKGYMTARDTIIADERLELDELATSLIAQVNALHRGGYGADGSTTGLNFFATSGGLAPSDAGDIGLNPLLVANPGYIGMSNHNTDGADTGQATTIAALRGFVMNALVQTYGIMNNGLGRIDPTVDMASGNHTLLNDGMFVTTANGGGVPVFDKAFTATSGNLVINGVAIPWSIDPVGYTGMSIEDLVGAINTNSQLNGTVRASFEYGDTCRFTLIGTGPITVWDDPLGGGNLAEVLKLETRISSLAAVNNGVGVLDRSIPVPGRVPPPPPPSYVPVPIGQSDLEWRTVAGPDGEITFQWYAPSGTVHASSYVWNGTQDLAAIVLGIDAQLTADGAPFLVYWNAATQAFTIEPDDTMALPVPTQWNPVTPVTITDTKGNLSMLFNMEAQPTFGLFSDSLLAQMQAERSNANAMVDQLSSGVDQLQLQQDAISKVNVDEEQAQLLAYTRAYEAAVRAMAVLDECLNVLINRMAASTFSGASTSSVLTS